MLPRHITSPHPPCLPIYSPTKWVEGTLLGWHTGVEVVRGCDWVRYKGWLIWTKNREPISGGSVLASEMQTGLILGRGDPIGAGYTGIEVLGGQFLVRCKERFIWNKKPKTKLQAQFWLAKCGRASFEVEGTPLGWGMLRLRCREGTIRSSMRGGLLGLNNQKPSCGGSVLASKMRADLIWGRGDPLGWGILELRYWEGAALVCGPLVPVHCLIYTPHLFTIVPSHWLHSIPSSPIVVHSTPLVLGLCLLYLMCLQLLPIRTRSTSHALGVPVCPCLCLLLPFLSHVLLHVTSVCSRLPVNAKLVFSKRNLYLPVHLT